MRNSRTRPSQGSTPGIYTSDLDEDLLCADKLVAALFGLDPAETVQGLPFESYLARMHPNDRPTVETLILDAVRDGQPYHAEYRTISANGEHHWVVSMGRCFRNRNSNPLYHAGIVYPFERL